MKLEDLTLDIEQHLDINAKPEKVFAAVLDRLGKNNTRPDGLVMDMNLEPTAGGKWYRDRGNGVTHLWGFVQAFKPSSLIELSWPMFMSYPVMNHIEVKVEAAGNGSKLHFRHRALGMIDPEHRNGVGTGWTHMLKNVKQDSEKA
jgi:uncharacterized protein YndB with AHSA1/START domain